MGKADVGAVPAVVAQPDDIGLGRQGAVPVAHTAAEHHAGADTLFWKVLFQICIGRCHIAVAETHGIEGDDRSAGGEVNIALSDVAVFFHIVHRNLVALDVALGFRLLGADADPAGESTFAGKAGVRVQPVHFDEDLVAHGRCKSYDLEITAADIRVAPIVLDAGGDDDRLAPAAGNAGRHADGHLDDELQGRVLMDDALDDEVAGSDPDLVVNNTGYVADVGRGVPENGFADQKPVGVDADESIVAGHLGGRADGGRSLHMRCQDLPGLHLGIRELLILPGDLGQLISCGSLSRSADLALIGSDGEDVAALDVPRGDILRGAGEIVEGYGRLCYHNRLMRSSL